MAKRPTKKPRSWLHDLRDLHWLTKVALGGVVLFVLTVAVTNAFGWPRLIPGFLGYAAAVLAIAAAGFAFSLWEHIRLFARERRWLNFTGALALFIGSLAIDAIGVHSGIMVFAEPWKAQMEHQADIDFTARQSELDSQRREIEREIADIQARLDAVPLVLPGRPQSDEQARLAWNERTAADRGRLEAKRDTLDALPRIAERPPVAPWLSQAVWAFSIFVEIVVAFGVSILGIEIAPRFTKGREEEAAPQKPAPAPTPAAVVTPITEARARRARAATSSRWSGWEDEG